MLYQVKLVLGLLLLILLLSPDVQGQQIQLKGSVLDKELTSLPYTHVYTGSQKGTYADIDANFYLNVQLGDTVSFSSIGYEIATLIITDSTARQEVTMLLKKKSIILEDIVVRDYYKANTVIRNSEDGERMKVPGVHYADPTPEAEKYHLGFTGAVSSPATALYRMASKKYKEEKRYFEESVVREKEEAEFTKAKKNLKEALEALGEDLDEYYYRDFMNYVGLTSQGVIARSTYDLVVLLKKPIVDYKKKLYEKE